MVLNLCQEETAGTPNLPSLEHCCHRLRPMTSKARFAVGDWGNLMACSLRVWWCMDYLDQIYKHLKTHKYIYNMTFNGPAIILIIEATTTVVDTMAVQKVAA